MGGESWRAQPAPAPGAAQLWSNSRTGHSWRCSSGQPQIISWQVTAWQPPVWCEQILAASVTQRVITSGEQAAVTLRGVMSGVSICFWSKIFCVFSQNIGVVTPWLSSPHYSDRCQFSDVLSSFGNISGIIGHLKLFVFRQVIKHKNYNKGWIIPPNPNMAGVLTIPKWCSGLVWKLFILFNLFIV